MGSKNSAVIWYAYREHAVSEHMPAVRTVEEEEEERTGLGRAC